MKLSSRIRSMSCLRKQHVTNTIASYSVAQGRFVPSDTPGNVQCCLQSVWGTRSTWGEQGALRAVNNCTCAKTWLVSDINCLAPLQHLALTEPPEGSKLFFISSLCNKTEDSTIIILRSWCSHRFEKDLVFSVTELLPATSIYIERVKKKYHVHPFC